MTRPTRQPRQRHPRRGKFPHPVGRTLTPPNSAVHLPVEPTSRSPTLAPRTPTLPLALSPAQPRPKGPPLFPYRIVRLNALPLGLRTQERRGSLTRLLRFAWSPPRVPFCNVYSFSSALANVTVNKVTSPVRMPAVDGATATTRLQWPGHGFSRCGCGGRHPGIPGCRPAHRNRSQRCLISMAAVW